MKKRGFFDNIFVLYIGSFILILLGQILGSVMVGMGYGVLSSFFPAIKESDAWITGTQYFMFIGIWVVVLLWLLIKKNRPIYKTLWTSTKGNHLAGLFIGFVIGFVLNGSCILIAWLHKDIVLYLDAVRPVSLLVIFLCVFVQSSAEEFICRGFLYQRLLKGYGKPVIAIVGNSLLFALLHLGNEGVTILSVINIFLTGILMSFAVYYMDSLWCAMALHTAWNFTQNIIFGLPNSGVVMPYSIFKLDAAKALNSFAYNVGFGVEGTILADVILMVACLLFYFWGRKYGRKPLDLWNAVSEETA